MTQNAVTDEKADSEETAEISKAAARKPGMKILGFRATAMIEMLVLMGVPVLLDYFFMMGERFISVSPHPFWIPVLLLSVQYGTGDGLLAAVVASLFLMVGNVPERSLTQDEFTYLFDLLHRPLMWFAAAVVLGELRTRHIVERDDLRREALDSQEREETITKAYAQLSKVKSDLEGRIAGQMRTVVTAYKAAKAMEQLDPAQVISGAAEMVRSTLGPQKFSVFLLEEDTLKAHLKEGWVTGDTYNATLDSKHILYQEVIGQQRFLIASDASARPALREEDSLMAGPLINRETNAVVGMLKVEKLGFMDFNLSTVENFKVLCEWVGAAYVNAAAFQDAEGDRVTNSDHQLFSYGFLPKQTQFIVALGRRLKFEVCLLVIRLDNSEDISRDQLKLVPKAISKATEVVFRNTDMAFDYQRPGFEFAILLPATPEKHMDIVLSKLDEAIEEHVHSVVPEAHFDFSVQVLHRPQEEAS
ncbi:MAG: GAF domain-containing protein [Magnetococcales bacterium]|nr:GAF domain-containing protein [Magnetococcales bacterium]